MIYIIIGIFSLFFMSCSFFFGLGVGLGITQSKQREKLLALAALWEETGSKSISNRIRLTLEHCAEDLRKLL